MKIKKIEIKNFRNIKHLVLDLARVSVITGQNNLGKSNTLNALNWLLTNTLLTDKYGEGENDLSSIIPINHTKGEHTEVSIWLDTNTKFTKVYKRNYDKITNKVIGHEPEYYVNDAKYKNMADFYNELYSVFNFYKIYDKLKINEVKLVTDPLYALLKLDYKELRKLLVAMGCSVSNEELYSLGFEDLRAYESQYMGKWDVMRKSLKDKLKALTVEIKEVESQIKLYSQVEAPNSDALAILQDKKTTLINRKSELLHKGSYQIVSDIENEITRLGLELEQKRNSKKLEYQAKINLLESDKHNYTSNYEKAKFEASRGIIEAINNLQNTLFTNKTELAEISYSIGSVEQNIRKSDFDIKNYQDRLTDLSVKLGNSMNDSDTMICPICGSSIELHKEEHENEIARLTEEITKLENDIATLEQAKANYNKELETYNAKKTELEILVNSQTNELAELKAQKITTESQFKPDDEIEKINRDIFEYQEKMRNINLEFETENKAINDLIEKKNITLMDSQKTINEESQKLDAEIQVLDEAIKKEYEDRHDFEIKVEKQKLFDVITSQYNDTEKLLTRLNDFIQAMCSMINDKAKEITGFNFVMIENNLTNDGITETCYVVDENGVPYKDINTARKVEMGIKFIDVVRKRNINTLPILVDRLEGIDDIKKIGRFTTQQIICTRVSMDENITVIKED